MTENLLDTLPEAFVSTTELSVAVSRAVKQGRLRKLASRLYTKNLTDPPEHIVRRHLWQLVASYVPGALIADRTALENVPAADGSIFVIADRKRDIELPGITIRPRKGAPPLEGDQPFVGKLFLSSPARAYLENMAPSRKRAGSVARTLSRKELEERLETMLRRGNPESLNKLRDRAREIAPELGLEDEFRRLDKLIGALLGTRDEILETPAGKARHAGTPFDPERVELFEKLHADLRAWPPSVRLSQPTGATARATLAFFEAYFSNFIEGTEFEVSEAADIVFRGLIPRGRPEDAHDVLGTWRVVSDRSGLARLPKDLPALFTLLRQRHAAIMGARPDKRPGEFKEAGNRAGATVFVAPNLVAGTLAQGFDFYRCIDSPFARAVFMMFMVSEVHPFADGNGRVARIMMNAELVAADEERIVIPTVYCNNYLAALKALSHHAVTEPLLRVLDYAQRWTASIDWGEFEETRRILEECNAFVEPNHADETGVRLRMPSMV
ncbi:MAG: Fic family protein [Roseovarius sp.]|nr:Fic family protein [Roseovarius sp.]